MGLAGLKQAVLLIKRKRHVGAHRRRACPISIASEFFAVRMRDIACFKRL